MTSSFPPPLSEEFEKKRWVDLEKMLTRPSPLAHEAFPAGKEVLEFVKDCKLLIVGAGGLGCDLVKNLALSGFKNIDIIDMDTIDTSNLNRQFLFRDKDVGSFKADTAANFINKRVPGVKVTAHNCRIEEKPLSFYQGFNIVICGLDSVEARRWINSTLFSFVKFDGEEPDMSTVIPYVDGGTEGFKGQARVIFPGVSACFECTLGLFTKDENFPLCTIKSKPRLPEHCIQYALAIQWKEKKSSKDIKDDESFDKDNPKHIEWIFKAATERAEQYNIRGVTYRLTQGVVKRIIPAIASTNAIIASACTNESLKICTLMAPYLNDYMFYNGNGEQGVFTYTDCYLKDPECVVCGQPKLSLKIKKYFTVGDFRQYFVEEPGIRLREPCIKYASGEYIYANFNISLEQLTKENYDKQLSTLISPGEMVLVSDRAVLKSEYQVTVNFED